MSYIVHPAFIFILLQMLLSHPLLAGNPQLEQQMRKEIPVFLQQVCFFLSLLTCCLSAGLDVCITTLTPLLSGYD